MTPPRLKLHDVINGLINLAGVSTQEAAIRSGVSPGTVASLRDHEPTQVVTWCRMASALGCMLMLESKGRSWPLEIARPSSALIEREWRAWRQRRFISALHSVSELQPRLKRSEKETKAHLYGANEEARLRTRLAEIRKKIHGLDLTDKATGLRQALRVLSTHLEITAEELALLAGVNLTAAQNALGEDHDGRLVTLHRLLSALGASLCLVLGGEGKLKVAPCPPGSWQPGDRDDEQPATDRITLHDADRALNRSRISSEQILSLYDADLSIGEIARQAGISRQRVHKIAMDAGRRPRRVLAKEKRIAQGHEMLS